MPAIVYHVGIFDKRDEPDYVRFVIKSQMAVLSKCCKSADIYLGMHANEDQVKMILDLAKECDLKVKDTMSYEHDLWEVPTVEWLQGDIAKRYAPDDYISYLHAKGIVGHNDLCRDYIMDYLFVPYEKNLTYLKANPHFNAAVICAYADHSMHEFGFHYSCWTAKVSHIRSIPPPPREDKRWASEHFMKVSPGEFWAIDDRLCLYPPENYKDTVVHGTSSYMHGLEYEASPDLQDVVLKISDEYKIPYYIRTKEEQKKAPPPPPVVEVPKELGLAPVKSTGSKRLHVAYGATVSVISALLIVFMILYFRRS